MKAMLERLLVGRDLVESEAAELLEALTAGAVPPVLAGALLAALRSKGETHEEVRGFARAMRRLAVRPELNGIAGRGVDIVGTGGDGSGSLNLSTGAALLTAACGQPVVKHGNGSISSRCGSADVLRELGLGLPLDETAAGRCLSETGFTFLFAPYYHPAMRELAPIRRALGVRTVFNLLGPLTNPASPPFLVAGAYSEPAAELMARTLSGMPVERAFVLHGEPGWDEATPVGPFVLFDVRDGHVERQVRDPVDYGIDPCSAEDLHGGDARENASRLRQALSGTSGPDRNAIILGAGLALEVTGRTENLAAGLAAATQAIEDGSAAALLAKLPGITSTPTLEPSHA